MPKKLVKFGIIGVGAFLIDFGILIFMTEVLGIHSLISNCISFSVSVIFNYIMSMKFVFESKLENKKVEFLVFLVLSIIGLGINEMILSVKLLDYRFMKVIATGIVMCFNFISRRVVFEGK